MVLTCAAYNCVSKSVKGGKISFHRFPKNEELRLQWVSAVQRANFIPSKYSYLCSNHFTDDCFEIRLGPKTLKKNAIPTLFNFTTKHDSNDSRFKKQLLETRICEETSSKAIDNSPKEDYSSTAICVSLEGDASTSAEMSHVFISPATFLELTISERRSSSDDLPTLTNSSTLTAESLEPLPMYSRSPRINILKIKSETTLKRKRSSDDLDISPCSRITIESPEYSLLNPKKKSIRSTDSVDLKKTKKKKSSDMKKSSIRKRYRYVGDCESSDFSSPDKCKSSWMIAKNQLLLQRNKIKRLRQANLRLRAKVNSLKDLISHFRNQRRRPKKQLLSIKKKYAI